MAWQRASLPTLSSLPLEVSWGINIEMVSWPNVYVAPEWYRAKRTVSKMLRTYVLQQNRTFKTRNQEGNKTERGFFRHYLKALHIPSVMVSSLFHWETKAVCERTIIIQTVFIKFHLKNKRGRLYRILGLKIERFLVMTCIFRCDLRRWPVNSNWVSQRQRCILIPSGA